jgi:hypothetical protein
MQSLPWETKIWTFSVEVSDTNTVFSEKQLIALLRERSYSFDEVTNSIMLIKTARSLLIINTRYLPVIQQLKSPSLQ